MPFPRLLLLAVLFSAALSSPAQATSSIRVGVGDQSVSMFESPAWKALGLRTTRYFFPWNGLHSSYQLQRANQFVDAAKAHGVSVLFHLSTDDYRAGKAKLPTVVQYRREIKRLVAHFGPRGVHEWGVWNEANHATEPTYRSPERAAAFFREVYQAAPAGDRIVALDVLDQAGVERYMARFYMALSPTFRGRAKIVGLHNYSDVNRTRSPATKSMIATARHYNPKARFWFTETGALVEFGRGFPCSTGRAAIRLPKVFAIADRYRSQGVDRVLLYNWQGPGCGKEQFDAGLVSPNGKVRKAYYVLKRLLPHYRR